MELTHEFEVPVSVGEVFDVLTDIERVAPCMPGATLDEINGDGFTGRVKVKVGPIQMTYRGTARFAEMNREGRTATIEANGTDSRGAGTARATITATLTEQGDGLTSVQVHTDLTVTGRPAQFGRGVMEDVGDKLLRQFADCLVSELGGGPGAPEAAEQPAAGAPSNAATTGACRAAPSGPRTADAETIDLLQVAGRPALRRAGPALAVVALVTLILWWCRR